MNLKIKTEIMTPELYPNSTAKGVAMLQRSFFIIALAAFTIGCGPSATNVSTLTKSAGAIDLSRLNVSGQNMFLSGINLAWNKFGRDFGDFTPEIDGYDHDYFDRTLATISQAGGNAARMWVHTSGEFNPKHDAKGFYICEDKKFFSDMTDLLRLAKKHNIAILFSMWSFDMLDNSKNPNAFGDHILERNKLLLTDPAYLDAYINNCYVKILETVKNEPAMFAIEILNEPEGMTPLLNWSISEKIPMKDVQRFIGKLAAMTHALAPRIKVTSGMASVDFLNYYQDEALKAASGETDGTLDFFEVHYYGSGKNPFTTAASAFSTDKPLIIGEFASTYPNLTEIYQDIFDLGYAGALSWKFLTTPGDLHGSWANGRVAPALGCLAAKHADAIRPANTLARTLKSQTDCSLKSSAGTPDNESNLVPGKPEYPVCLQSGSDPDHDGWGWENNASCKVKS